MMKTTSRCSLIVISLSFLLAQVLNTRASSTLRLATADHMKASAAVFRGVVVGVDCYRDGSGQILTRTSLHVDESLKGTFPAIVAIVNPGGSVGLDAQYYGLSPIMKRGEERVVFAMRRADGKLTCTQGAASATKLLREEGQLSAAQQLWLDEVRAAVDGSGEDVRDQAGSVTSELTTGLTDRGGGIPARFVQGDRREPIPCLIDADFLPAGMTLAQATNAVVQALNAWAAVTGLKFRFDGLQSFGQGADVINADDEKLRIQLHDAYNRINSVNILGIGGQYTSAVLLSGAGWGAGGNVAGNEFYKSSGGYVVLEHGVATMQNLASFTEVLCHEIGHALSMAHSSENPSEPNSTLKQSIMYYQIHADGRGATLGTYDPPVIQQAYPTNNTPPYSYNRYLDVTTASSAPNVAGINEVTFRGYDLQNNSLTFFLTNATSGAGTFSAVGQTVKFTPGFFSAPRVDPGSGSYYDRVFVRYSDGVNASAYATLATVSLNVDSFPTTRDGIPDDWMTAYFGSANPAAGANRGAQQDYDGDGLRNIDEYRAGMDPTSPSAAQRITLMSKTDIQFQAKAYELYELQATTNFTNWVRAANPVIPTTSTGSFSGFTNTAPYLFFRVEKVP